MNVDECNGCGFCCYKAKCVAAARLYPAAEICPALKWTEEKKRYVCDLMQLPGNLGEIYRKELYAGEGCCMNLNTWRKVVQKRREIELEHKTVIIPKIFQMFLASLGREWISQDALYLAIMGFQQNLIKDGYIEEEAKEIGILVAHYLKGNRPSIIKDFM